MQAIIAASYQLSAISFWVRRLATPRSRRGPAGLTLRTASGSLDLESEAVSPLQEIA